MSNKVKRMLAVLLLVILTETGPTTACSSSCSSSDCECNKRGLSSVPQNLPSTITWLHLWNNVITTLNQSDFSRYSSLTYLDLSSNQISVINSGTFFNLSRLTGLYINNNQLTSLQVDMFLGLDNLEYLYLDNNNIRSIEAGTFSGTPQLRDLSLLYNIISTISAETFVTLTRIEWLVLSHNYINTFPIEVLANLNSSVLWQVDLSYNQMETLPPTAYDILASIRTVDISIHNNPWQCDCRMLPFKQRMRGFSKIERQIRCVGPINLVGQSLSYSVHDADLTCEETTTSPSPGSTVDTSPDGFSLPNFLSGFLGVTVGIIITSAVFLVIWCSKKKGKTSPALDTRDTAGCHDNKEHELEPDDVERGSDPVHEPVPYSFDPGYRPARPPLPPITGASP
uniref:LRRCT domain-containing protein n=1 Tax=Branchiostoma floridae TaxID=7739 RepID=C3ZQ52_BRAFL|eukprot:XP_002589420.1 hypothetical protein BRAFLDRAFT_77866 [Branchiostoma floridae]